MTHPAVIDWLDRAQARADAATPGPWLPDPGGDGISGPATTDSTGYTAPVAIVITDSGTYPPGPADEAFITEARGDLPCLLEAVRSVLDVADELATQPATVLQLSVARRLQDAVYTALFPAPEATDAR